MYPYRMWSSLSLQIGLWPIRSFRERLSPHGTPSARSISVTSASTTVNQRYLNLWLSGDSLDFRNVLQYSSINKILEFLRLQMPTDPCDNYFRRRFNSQNDAF